MLTMSILVAHSFTLWI